MSTLSDIALILTGLGMVGTAALLVAQRQQRLNHPPPLVENASWCALSLPLPAGGTYVSVAPLPSTFLPLAGPWHLVTISNQQGTLKFWVDQQSLHLLTETFCNAQRTPVVPEAAGAESS